MNWGLEKYKDNKDVMAVVGYNYPMDMTGYDEPYFLLMNFLLGDMVSGKINMIFFVKMYTILSSQRN